MLKFIKYVFNFREHRRQLLFIILIVFLLSFFAARVYSLYFGHSIFISGYHVHHFYFGMLFLSAGGILGVLSVGKKQMQFASGLIGIGIGLFADELGLLLNCTTASRECTYAFPDVFDIVVFISVVILFIVILISFVEKYLMIKAGRNISKISS